MQTEVFTLQVGKVYKCGDYQVKIVFYSEETNLFVGFEYDEDEGRIATHPYISAFSVAGIVEQGCMALDCSLEELPSPKETIKIGDVEYDKEEFEKATAHLKPFKK